MASACLLACGGRSELDDYADGVPGIVPQPTGAGGGNQGDGDGDGDGGDGDGDGMNPSGAEGAEVGEACQIAGDCMGGANATCLKTTQVQVLTFPLTITFPGGYCAIGKCANDGDCPTGSACLTGLGDPTCSRLCTDNTQCRADEGYTCNTIMLSTDPRKFCQPPFDLPAFPGGGGGFPGGGGGFPGGGGGFPGGGGS